MLDNKFIDEITKTIFPENDNYSLLSKIVKLMFVCRESGHSAVPIYTLENGEIYIEKDLYIDQTLSTDDIRLISDCEDALKIEEIRESIQKSDHIHMDANQRFMSFQGDWFVEKEILKILKESYSRSNHATVLDSILNNKISLLTGGPGSGKTYQCVEIVKSVLEKYPDKTIAMLATTGKAVDVVKEKISSVIEDEICKSRLSFSTVHSFVGMKSLDEDYLVNVSGYDVIIIDESSMLYSKMLLRVLMSIKTNASVLLVGDENQLPAIACGSIFHELCKFDVINKITLKGNKRAKNREVIDIADKVLNETLSESDIKYVNFSQAVDVIEEHLKDMQIDSWIIDSEDKESIVVKEVFNKMSIFKILSLSNLGELGTVKINNIIENKLKALTIERGAAGYASPAIATVNQKNISISNGSPILLIKYVDVNYKNKCWYHNGIDIICVDHRCIKGLLLAWAITVHKSQGSAYNRVAIIVNSAKRCTKSHLYTAITRARNTVEIFIYKDNDISLYSILKNSYTRFSSILKTSFLI